MTLARLAAGAAVVLLSVTVPAGAQGLSASGYKATQDYAACLMNDKPTEARAMIEAAPESREANGAEARLTASATCEKGGAKTAGLRGAVAERLYLQDFTAAPAALTGPAPAFTANADVNLIDYEITRCTALRDPVDADAFVRSEPKSDGEKTALKGLMPTLGSCVAKGGKIGFDKERMRGLLAEGLLRTRGASAN